MHFFHTPDSDHSQLNELDGMPNGSSAYSNQPNDAWLDFFFVVCDACITRYVVYYVIYEYNWYYCLL
jgi:hypothetical protein